MRLLGSQRIGEIIYAFAVSHITATIPKTGLRKLTPGMSQTAPAARTPNVATSKMHSFRDVEESVVGVIEIWSCIKE
jgi:hypothetical protein